MIPPRVVVSGVGVGWEELGNVEMGWEVMCVWGGGRMGGGRGGCGLE